jgi:hypothetical protein
MVKDVISERTLGSQGYFEESGRKYESLAEDDWLGGRVRQPGADVFFVRTRAGELEAGDFGQR